MKILVANGVNLDLLGQREPAIYGQETLGDLEVLLCDFLKATGKATPFEIDLRQTNEESVYLEWLTEKPWAGILLNPGAWTHTSIALHDRLKTLTVPVVEVHLSHPASREVFRSTNYITSVCSASVSGFGIRSYVFALEGLLAFLARGRSS